MYGVSSNAEDDDDDGDDECVCATVFMSTCASLAS